MAFHALLCIRDEDDIVLECLDHLLLWADHIHVFDTGSTDDTWNMVCERALVEKRIIPHARRAVWFNDAVTRAWLFEISRSMMRDGDWVARVDADEFYDVMPPEFIKSRLQRIESALYFQRFEFCFLDSELSVGSEMDCDMTVQSRRRWYTVNTYAEPRFFKYRSNMQWPSNASFPYHAGFVAEARIPIRHYPHRYPFQMHKKCVIRSVMIGDKCNSQVWQQASTHHWRATDWRTLIVPRDTPGLLFWKFGEPLPEINLTNHLPSRLKRVIQRVLNTHHPLTVLDAIRSWQSATICPAPMEPTINAAIVRLIGESIGKATSRRGGRSNGY